MTPKQLALVSFFMIQALQSKRQHHFMLMRQLFFLRQRWRGRFSYNKLLFLTDNLSLARASATNSISAQQVPWELRDVMASFFQISTQIQAAIFHIKRDLNGVAHDCAQQALKTIVSEPIFRCNSSTHSNSLCPISDALISADIQGYVLYSVYCA
jgi:hypothetical protein